MKRIAFSVPKKELNFFPNLLSPLIYTKYIRSIKGMCVILIISSFRIVRRDDTTSDWHVMMMSVIGKVTGNHGRRRGGGEKF